MNIKLNIILFLLLGLLLNDGIAQNEFSRDLNFIVLDEQGNELKNPWAGGFNSVQFSEIDLNLDGIMDLFVFDRVGNRISTFINSGLSNQIVYKYVPSFVQKFPKNMKNWVLLRDYNCDGKMDIFTHSPGGMSAYRNTSSSKLSFTLDTNLIYTDYNNRSTPNYINMYMSASNLPAIDDIDGDGDLDVLAFDIFGSLVQYHKNLSIEKYGTCDSLDFLLTNSCWGYFRYQIPDKYVLRDTCTWNVSNPEDITPIPHLDEGVSLLTIDVDGNNTKDLIVSSFANKNFNLLTNNDLSGNQTASSLTSQDTLFPKNNSNSIATDLNIFPAGFYLDINNDNIKDLVVAPNYPYACKDRNNVWLYENKNADNNPSFNLTKSSFLQEGMIDVGSGAHPTFFDHNGDGLIDILIGNHGAYDETDPLFFKSSLFLYENIGTASVPSYQLVDSNYMNISSMLLNLDSNSATLGLSPTFGDLDNDNDLDMIIGDYNGYIHYFTNTAGSGNTASFVLTQAQFENINVGSDATPFLYDINNDQLLDLVIGNLLGTFHYYKNEGTSASPTYRLITDSLGKVTTRKPFKPLGNSYPVIIDSMGTTLLYAGSRSGDIYKFGNIDGNLNGTFQVIDSSLSNIWDGANASISIADVTNDGKLDMLLGNYAGGISFYNGDVVLSTDEIKRSTNFSVYPNPTKDNINIDFEKNSLNNAKIELMDLLGKVVHHQKVNNQKISISLSEYNTGIYIIKFSNNHGNYIRKVVKR